MSKYEPAATAGEISTRLSEVLARYTLEDVVRLLAEVGHSTSIETVRRYREGLAQRIDSAFLAAVVTAIGVDASWLLTGPNSPEEMVRQIGFRAAHVLGDVAQDAAAGYIGPPAAVEWQEEVRREMAADFVRDFLKRIDVPLDVAIKQLSSTMRAEELLSQLEAGDRGETDAADQTTHGEL